MDRRGRGVSLPGPGFLRDGKSRARAGRSTGLIRRSSFTAERFSRFRGEEAPGGPGLTGPIGPTAATRLVGPCDDAATRHRESSDRTTIRLARSLPGRVKSKTGAGRRFPDSTGEQACVSPSSRGPASTPAGSFRMGSAPGPGGWPHQVWWDSDPSHRNLDRLARPTPNGSRRSFHQAAPRRPRDEVTSFPTSSILSPR